jgi:hypothetical protein
MRITRDHSAKRLDIQLIGSEIIIVLGCQTRIDPARTTPGYAFPDSR